MGSSTTPSFFAQKRGFKQRELMKRVAFGELFIQLRNYATNQLTRDAEGNHLRRCRFPKQIATFSTGPCFIVRNRESGSRTET